MTPLEHLSSRWPGIEERVLDRLVYDDSLFDGKTHALREGLSKDEARGDSDVVGQNRARMRARDRSHPGRAKSDEARVRRWLELNSISRAFSLEFVKVLIVTKVGHNGRVQA